MHMLGSTAVLSKKGTESRKTPHIPMKRRDTDKAKTEQRTVRVNERAVLQRPAGQQVGRQLNCSSRCYLLMGALNEPVQK